MSFPVSPVDGQIYNNRIYSNGAWNKLSDYDFGDGSVSSTFHKLPWENNHDNFIAEVVNTLDERKTFDVSSMVPVGTKSVKISAMVHGHSTTGNNYAYSVTGLCDNNTFDGNYKNTTTLSFIGGTGGLVSYEGGTQEVTVKLDANRKFYSFTTTFHELDSLGFYFTIVGYYI